MPQAIPALIAGAAALLGGASVYAALAKVALVLVLTQVSSWLTKKPSGPTSFSSSLNITSQAPDETGEIIYGRTMVGGTRTYAEATSSGKYLHLIHVLSYTEVADIEEIRIDGNVVPLDVDGNATGKYAGYVRVKKHFGAWNQAADADLVAESALWTTNHRNAGLANVYIRLQWNAELFSSDPQITAVVKGRKIYDQRDPAQDPNNPETWLWSDNPVLCIQDVMRGILYVMKAAA